MTKHCIHDAAIKKMIGEGMYPAEIARKLGITRDGVASAAKRLGLKDIPNGKSLRFQRGHHDLIDLSVLKDPDIYVGEVTYPAGIKFTHSIDELRAMCREALAEIDGEKE